MSGTTKTNPIYSMSMWVIYDHPSDFSESFVARKWIVTNNDNQLKPTELTATGSLKRLREYMTEQGLTCFLRQREDDPVIVETWM